jgi:hypothetical protein
VEACKQAYNTLRGKDGRKMPLERSRNRWDNESKVISEEIV